MADAMIKVEKLSKRYILRHEGKERYVALRDVIADRSRDLLKRIKNPLGKENSGFKKREEFWALKDIDIEVAGGERIGIIGRNGAGKSTLLKIISRITEPTHGKVTLAGRTASLLEVGTGFHPELTGRENIFLNGAIIGMSKKEIQRKFDEIVAFAEVERFLDTPVKRYSSGMYVRLAFAIAAHLEPEIFIVDEVLAVGDTQFQKKCIGKMEDISCESSRTVLFVSHNMAAIKSLCRRCLVLDNGGVVFDGEVGKAVEVYLELASRISDEDVPISERKRGGGLSLRAKIMDFRIITPNGENPQYIDSTKPFTVRFFIESYADNTRVGPQLYISDESQRLIWIDSGVMNNKIYTLSKGTHKIECEVGPTFLYAGMYRFSCVLALPGKEVIDYIPEAVGFEVLELDPTSSGYNLHKNYGFGLYYVPHKWSESEVVAHKS